MMQKSHIYLLLLAGSASAHTWLESLRSIGSNGAFTGEPGYPRGFVARTDPSFSDDASTYRILAKDASTPLCHPAQQVANGYTNPQFPRLNSSAGSWVALTYQENGHVSAPQVPEGRPYRSGNIYVYATTTLRDEEFSSVHGNWTADGSLESGRLIATRYFDDENCFQNQGSGPTPINAERKAASQGLASVDCQTDIQLPEDIDSDVVGIYWVWDWTLWPNMQNQAFEIYTGCAEISISQGDKSEVAFDDSVPLDQRAVKSQIATQFEVFELGTGTAAPPPVTSLPSNTASAASLTSPPTTTGTSTVSETNEFSGFTTILVPSATVTVTVTQMAAPSA